MNEQIQINRRKWLSVLRSGNYKKGKVPKMDSKGRVIEVTDGYCACAILVHEMGGTFAQAKKAVGVTSKQCAFIQSELSDKLETFEEVALKIESDIFKFANC